MSQMEQVQNKQIILKDYVNGFPKESDMPLITSSTIRLNLPNNSNAILVKNLYLSCDPYMRGRMSESKGSYIDSFTPGSVSNFIFIHIFNTKRSVLTVMLFGPNSTHVFVCFKCKNENSAY
ncbi:putative oxidoreductase [Helianthus anomalus]